MVAFRRRRRNITISVTQNRKKYAKKNSVVGWGENGAHQSASSHRKCASVSAVGSGISFPSGERIAYIELCDGMRKRNDIEYENGARRTIESQPIQFIIQ